MSDDHTGHGHYGYGDGYGDDYVYDGYRHDNPDPQDDPMHYLESPRLQPGLQAGPQSHPSHHHVPAGPHDVESRGDFTPHAPSQDALRRQLRGRKLPSVDPSRSQRVILIVLGVVLLACCGWSVWQAARP